MTAAHPLHSDWSERVPDRRVPPAEAITHFEEVLLGYDPPSATAEAQRGLGLSYEPARRDCPFGVDVAGLVRNTAAGDFDAAAAGIRQAHPWAAILGRCCHKFCEQAMLGAYPTGLEPLNLSGLERAAGEYGHWEPTEIEVPPSGKGVAVVGAGSGGLALAQGLLRAGHAVTIFDALPDIGGMFIVGYPPFRMPRRVVQRELPIRSSLLRLELGQRIDRPRLEHLFGEYDAVCLASGQFLAADVQLPGDDLDGVYEALPFLEEVALHGPPSLGEHVIVVGAGYSAQDAARTARRLGAKVQVVYRRSQAEMPVRPAKRASLLKMMQAEGISHQFLVDVTRIIGEAGRVVGIECQRMRLGGVDESGRARPEPSNEPAFVLPATTVITAFGQRPDFSLLPHDVAVDGSLVVHDRYRSTLKGLFVVGDIAGNVGNDGAFAGGLEAAAEMNRYLADPLRSWPVVDPHTRMSARRPAAALGGG
jgi:formate dehydrogenase major subunit